MNIQFELPEDNKYFCVNDSERDFRCPCYDSEFNICRLFNINIQMYNIDNYESYSECKKDKYGAKFRKETEEYIKNNKLEWCFLAERCQECINKFGV